MPICVTGAGTQKRACMRTGLTKQEKTTDIWFDEKDPLIHIRTHNTAMKNVCLHTAAVIQRSASRPTQTWKRAAWSVTLRKIASLSV